jgi:chaperonin cofactor prefoldin
MRKPLSLILACLTSGALAADTKDPAPAPADAPAAVADSVDPAAEGSGDEPAGPTIAELEALAARAAKAELARLALAAEARRSAKGEKHEYITTKKGRTYKKVTISGVDEIGVKIFHESGTARIKFAELPTTFQQRFGYDPDRAKALLEREKQLENARDQATIARLRVEAGLPPEPKATTRPPTTRPPTTRPTTRPPTTRPTTRPPTTRPTTRPPTTRPKTTGPTVTRPIDKPEGSGPNTTNSEVAALTAEIATFEAEVEKIKDVAKGIEALAKKAEEKAFAKASRSAGDAKFDEASMKKAADLRDKAEAEYRKMSSLRSKITKNKRAIKKLERGR